MTIVRKISTCLFLLGISLVVTAAPGAVYSAASKRRAFINKLNLFVTQVQRGFDRIGESIDALKDDVDTDRDMIAKLTLQKLDSSVRYLDSISPVCPNGYAKRFRRCFKFIQCAKSCSTDDGKQQCEGEGGQLASALSLDEQNFFIHNMNKTTHIWLAGNDRTKEGTWVWADGSLIKNGFNSWNKGEPNSGQSYDCLYLLKSSGKWYDYPCANKQSKGGYVCQLPLTFDHHQPAVN